MSSQKIKIRKEAAIYTFDQFFTRTEVAQQCVDYFLQYYDWSDFDLVLEPSAGTGSFYDLFPNHRQAVEIDPRLCREDWMTGSFYDHTFNGQVACIGNPPFGTQNSESVRFFNHAAQFAQVIAFIIPRTWNNPSIQNRLDLHFHLKHTLSLEGHPFEAEKLTAVRCCFQIWERGILRKKVKQAITHPDWEFLKYSGTGKNLHPPTDADFVILAYGSNPGQINDDLYRWRPKSVHFIKAKIDVQTLKERFEKLDYSGADNSARQSSLGKGALIQLYEELHGVNGIMPASKN